MTLSYEQRSIYCCEVCDNVPDKFGVIDHGRGCFTQSENGGGTSYVELPETDVLDREAMSENIDRLLDHLYNDFSRQWERVV